MLQKLTVQLLNRNDIKGLRLTGVVMGSIHTSESFYALLASALCNPDVYRMSKFADISKPESRNWLKQWQAVYITRQALLTTVNEEATLLHGQLLRKAPLPECTTCSSRDVQHRNARCPFHTVLRDELVNEHAYGHTKSIGALTLKNTKAENWGNSPWEIAKLFMPPSGYENKTTIDDTDFNGIAGFIINCKRFHGKIAVSICEKTLKDDDAYRYIYQMLNDDFQHRLANIEMKLQTTGLDLERAKEYIHTESQQHQKNLEEVFGALERFSDDAMHELSGIKEDNILSIKTERKRVMDHITFRERKAIEQIEQCLTDGKIMLETHVKEKRRQVTEHIERSVTEGKITLETHVKEESRRATDNIEQSVTEENTEKDGRNSILRNLTLGNICAAAGVFMNLISMVIQSRHFGRCRLEECAEANDMSQLQEEMGNQPVLKVVTPGRASPDFNTRIALVKMTVSAGMFMRLVSVVLQSGHYVEYTLEECIIEDVINQPALQMVTPHLALPGYTTHIKLKNVKVPARVFRRLVSVMIQSGHSVNCRLTECSIEEDNGKPLDEMGNQPAPQFASRNFTTHIMLRKMTLSADVFRRFVSLVIQSGQSVHCDLVYCIIKMDNQPAPKVVLGQPASPEFTSHFMLNRVTVSAGLVRRFVSMVLQSKHTVHCELKYCTILPVEEVLQLQIEMEKLPAPQVNGFSRNEEDLWCIMFNVNV
ncbi:hypothetical protein MAR_006959 [Mya arenaria]|uniref:Uncharacterized protein n=1 Tax=Mya arenaria TaxID=6604 RepID=A0ABY7DB28_MYAAR|nr:hypothetical protein MAR_006959 [Mya arenaria]